MIGPLGGWHANREETVRSRVIDDSQSGPVGSVSNKLVLDSACLKHE